MEMKILTYNINGIRAAMNKGLTEWLASVDADIVCFQEIKANPEQFDTTAFEKLGYHCYWFPAQKKGYSGTAILSKIKPTHVEIGCGNPIFDYEGRILRADFPHFSVISAYFPSGSSGDLRQDVKMNFLDFFQQYIDQLKTQSKPLIICGDVNICHQAIDIHDPVSNKNSSGFLPEERAWLSAFLESGFTDTFRFFNPQPHQYSWWSYRANARERNKGWRIDYIFADDRLQQMLKKSLLLPEAKHSDHCPVLLYLETT